MKPAPKLPQQFCRFCGWKLRPNPMCCWSAREEWERAASLAKMTRDVQQMPAEREAGQDDEERAA